MSTSNHSKTSEICCSGFLRNH